MQALDAQTTGFPNVSLLMASAHDFGLLEQAGVSTCLNAILSTLLSFSWEAENGNFSSIFLAYGNEGERVQLMLDRQRDADYLLTIEHLASRDSSKYLGGLVAQGNGLGDWNVESAQVLGQPISAAAFLSEISKLRNLNLLSKEIGEVSVEH